MLKKLFGWGKKDNKNVTQSKENQEELFDKLQRQEEANIDNKSVEEGFADNEVISEEIEYERNIKENIIYNISGTDGIETAVETNDTVYELKNDIKEAFEGTDIIMEQHSDIIGKLDEEDTLANEFETNIIDSQYKIDAIANEYDKLSSLSEIENDILESIKDTSDEENQEIEYIEGVEQDFQEIEVDQEEYNLTSKVADEIVIVENKEEDSAEAVSSLGFFTRLKAGLSKTTKNFTDKLTELFECYEGVSEQVYEDLEEILIMADVGFETTNYIVDTLRKRVLEKTISDTRLVQLELQSIIAEILSKEGSEMNINNGASVITIIGVNGVGKTTTIGKLANKYKKIGKKVILAAADTFRAAAAEQLDIWAKRAEVEIVKHGEGADPSAVIFDGIKAAKARNADILICDTAGRLHNKKNLMMELEKIFRIIDREYQEANKEVLLVIDATTGQNAISQAKLFKEVAPLTGIILTKLDGTAKGGVVLGIIQELGLPVKYIGVGEKLDDLQEFDSQTFAKALFGER
ncbi:MAG: signal recognition particle-docking protein FtsY [Filifactoraceae bacterium]